MPSRVVGTASFLRLTVTSDRGWEGAAVNLDPEACLAALAERGLLPDDRASVFLAGSLVRGWGNATSDLDAYVITDGAWAGETTTSSPVCVAPGAVPVHVFYLDDRRWDVEFWQDSQVDELLDAVSWKAFDSGERTAASLEIADLGFLQRLVYSLPLEGAGWLERRRQQLQDSAVRTMVAAHQLYVHDHLVEDALGMLGNDDADSAVIAAHLALGAAVDAMLATYGEITDQAKWRARRMRAVDPPQLSFDEYWTLQTMRTLDPAAPDAWVREVLRVCQRITDSLEL